MMPRNATSSFNEAAGIPRGRRIESRKYSTPCRASMRPRVFPAEDFLSRWNKPCARGRLQ